CTPNNPTGRVLSGPELEGIAELCRRYDAYAVTDEIYEHIYYEGKHIPIATLDGMRERTITISGASKTFSVTGWRVGTTVAPPTDPPAAPRARRVSRRCRAGVSSAAPNWGGTWCGSRSVRRKTSCGRREHGYARCSAPAEPEEPPSQRPIPKPQATLPSQIGAMLHARPSRDGGEQRHPRPGAPDRQQYRVRGEVRRAQPHRHRESGHRDPRICQRPQHALYARRSLA